MRLYYEKLREVATPTRSYSHAAGWDFYIPTNFTLYPFAKLRKQYREEQAWEHKVVSPQRSLFIPSGLRIELPKGIALRFDNKSGIAVKGLIVGASIVDQDYQGEIHLHLWNVSEDDITVKAGMKILQGIFFQTQDIEFYESTRLFSTASARGANGFGSSDKINK
jgi:dUTP pyrophosphatase